MCTWYRQCILKHKNNTSPRHCRIWLQIFQHALTSKQRRQARKERYHTPIIEPFTYLLSGYKWTRRRILRDSIKSKPHAGTNFVPAMPRNIACQVCQDGKATHSLRHVVPSVTHKLRTAQKWVTPNVWMSRMCTSQFRHDKSWHLGNKFLTV